MDDRRKERQKINAFFQSTPGEKLFHKLSLLWKKTKKSKSDYTKIVQYLLELLHLPEKSLYEFYYYQVMKPEGEYKISLLAKILADLASNPNIGFIPPREIFIGSVIKPHPLSPPILSEKAFKKWKSTQTKKSVGSVINDDEMIKTDLLTEKTHGNDEYVETEILDTILALFSQVKNDTALSFIPAWKTEDEIAKNPTEIQRIEILLRRLIRNFMLPELIELCDRQPKTPEIQALNNLLRQAELRGFWGSVLLQQPGFSGFYHCPPLEPSKHQHPFDQLAGLYWAKHAEIRIGLIRAYFGILPINPSEPMQIYSPLANAMNDFHPKMKIERKAKNKIYDALELLKAEDEKSRDFFQKAVKEILTQLAFLLDRTLSDIKRGLDHQDLNCLSFFQEISCFRLKLLSANNRLFDPSGLSPIANKLIEIILAKINAQEDHLQSDPEFHRIAAETYLKIGESITNGLIRQRQQITSLPDNLRTTARLWASPAQLKNSEDLHRKIYDYFSYALTHIKLFFGSQGNTRGLKSQDTNAYFATIEAINQSWAALQTTDVGCPALKMEPEPKAELFRSQLQRIYS